MKNKLIYPLIATFLLAGATACRSDHKSATQQQYETVQEGSAAGVTSTIHGPGETIPPLTGTNADTTTAFAFNPAAAPAPNTQVGGTIAGTLPPPMTSASSAAPDAGPGSYVPQQPVTRGIATTRTTTVTQQPRPVSPQPQAQQPQMQPSEPQPAQPTETVEPARPAQPAPPADTTASQPPPPAQTQTAPPPSSAKPEKKKEKPPAEQQEQEPETDSAEPPPPPPSGR